MNWSALNRSRQTHSVVSLMAFTFFMWSSPSVRLRRECEGWRAVSGIGLTVVFPVYGVTDVVAFVLYSPVAAGIPVHVGGGHLSCFPAGEDEGVFLADAAAGDLEYLTADHGGLGAGIRQSREQCLAW